MDSSTDTPKSSTSSDGQKLSQEPIQSHAENFQVAETPAQDHVQETVTFQEGAAVYSMDTNAVRDPSYNAATDNTVPISKFLSRPVRIYEGTWTTTFTESSLDITFDPWTLWQSDARIKDKLTNYAYLSCDMVLRIQVNGTPFQYGQLMFVYIPYGGSNTTLTNNIRNDSNQVAQCAQQIRNGASTSSAEAAFQHFSTYPHVFIEPSQSGSSTMTLPFMWHNNFISINGIPGVGKETLGVIRVYDLNPLRVCNTNAPQQCNFTVWGHAENINLTVPTEFVPTAGKDKDEYNDDGAPVSMVSSAVASAAGKLTKVPVIGPFARATQIGAQGVSDIAKIFGFSAPTMVAPPSLYMAKQMGRYAVTTGADSSSKLSVDPEQEICVDPRTMGVAANDEMAISSIVSREQWIARGEWRSANGQFTTSGAETIVFASLVSPSHTRRTGTETMASGQQWQAIQDCPAGWVSNVFSHWRGSITYRVQVVCSKMHSGRLLVQFDPFIKSGSYAVSDVVTTDVNARHTAILDLGKTNEIEMTIPYNNRRAWLHTQQNSSFASYEPQDVSQVAFTVQSNYDYDVHMGMFVVSVLNELVAPIDTTATASATSAPVQVNIYMRAGEDMQFAQPSEGTAGQTVWSDLNYVPVAGIDQDCSTLTEPVDQVEIFKPSHDETGPMVFFGERIPSIRNLIKRYSVVFAGKYNNDTTSSTQAKMMTRYIPHVNAQVMRGEGRRQSFLSYFMPAFLCVRGATRWKFEWVHQTDQNEANFAQSLIHFVERYSQRGSLASVGYSVPTLISTSPVLDLFNKNVLGGTFTHSQYQPMLEAEFPFYSNTRFMLGSFLVNVDNDSNESIRVNPTMDSVIAGRYRACAEDIQAECNVQHIAAGDDFTMSFFTGVPMQFEHQGP